MGRPLRIEYPGAYYHVTSRGNEQKDVFKSRRDREKFLAYLQSATDRYGAAIQAYCLMNNHYHLLLETPVGNLSQIMRHINGAYTNYFNVKKKRAGHLFQGRYKAILVEADAYAAELSRYIHLNPVRAGIVAKPEEYQWSSYRSYIGQGRAPEWLNMEFVLGYFGNNGIEARTKYHRFVSRVPERDYASPLERSVASAILGSLDFIAEIDRRHLCKKEPDRNLPGLRRLSRRLSVDEIIQEVKGCVGEDERLADKVSIYFCHKFSGARLKEIGERFGVGESAISQTSRRLEQNMKENEELKKVVEKVKARLGIVKV